MYREDRIDTGFGVLHCVQSGDGPLILFVHGFPSTSMCWRRQMDALSDRFRVVAIDALGAGGSDRPAEDTAYAIDQLAAGLGVVADTVAPGEIFVLVGHDWGAALAFAFAQAHPDRLRAVAGLSAPPYSQFLRLVAHDHDQQRRSAYMQAFRALTPTRIAAEDSARRLAEQTYAPLAARGLITADDYRQFVADVGRDDALWGGTGWYRANIPPFDEIGDGDAWPPSDPPLAIPSLLIWGDADQTFVGHVPDAFAARHPDAEVLRLPGVGHWPMLEAPAAVTAALLQLIARAGERPAVDAAA